MFKMVIITTTSCLLSGRNINNIVCENFLTYCLTHSKISINGSHYSFFKYLLSVSGEPGFRLWGYSNEQNQPSSVMTVLILNGMAKRIKR